MEPEKSFQILMDGRGTHWDGAFVEVFVDMMQREGPALILPRPRPPQLAVSGLLDRPYVAQLDAARLDPRTNISRKTETGSRKV